MENRKRKMLIALLSFSISLFLTFSILLAYLYLKDRKSRRKKGGKLAQCVNIEEAIERYNAKREKNETRNGTPQEALEELRRRGLHSVANMVEKKHH